MNAANQVCDLAVAIAKNNVSFQGWQISPKNAINNLSGKAIFAIMKKFYASNYIYAYI